METFCSATLKSANLSSMGSSIGEVGFWGERIRDYTRNSEIREAKGKGKSEECCSNHSRKRSRETIIPTHKQNCNSCCETCVPKRVHDAYFAQLILTKYDNEAESISFDLLPSDAINIAVRCTFCDGVGIARLLNATLVLPKFEVAAYWNESS